jgi:hypothetical protein
LTKCRARSPLADTCGLVKLVADAGTGRLLGAHILAPEDTDGIQTAALAIRQDRTVGDLADAIVPYLATVEGLKLAALGFAKDVAKLSCSHSTPQYSPSLPLDGARRLRRDVVGHLVDAAHFIDDAVGSLFPGRRGRAECSPPSGRPSR